MDMRPYPPQITPWAISNISTNFPNLYSGVQPPCIPGPASFISRHELYLMDSNHLKSICRTLFLPKINFAACVF